MKTRQSEIELLRIVVMTLIVITHLTVWGIMKTDNASSAQLAIGGVTNAVIRWHVNVFVLITGFFGVRSRKGLVKIIVMSMFYTWLLYLLQCLFCGEHFSVTPLLKSLFFVTHSQYWFVQSYVLLVLIAPYLNSLLESHNRYVLTGILLFIDCWCGYFHNETISTGFGLLHFATMYVIGRCLYMTNGQRSTPPHLHLLTIFVVTIGLLAIQHLIPQTQFGKGYNNPLLVICSVVVFLLFRRMNIKNEQVNWLSASSFAVYLIHDSKFGHYWIKEIMTWENATIETPLYYLLAMIATGIMIYMACAMADKALSYFYNPISRIISKKINKHVCKSL